jgi:hypothetical protein
MDQVINLAEATGWPKQVSIANDQDPLRVLQDAKCWEDLMAREFPIGCKFEFTNHDGSFLWEVWVRMVQGFPIRSIRFHHRVVWDERAEAVAVPVAATGSWEVRYDGRHYRWRVYSPKGLVQPHSWNSEAEANTERRTLEANTPRAR